MVSGNSKDTVEKLSFFSPCLCSVVCAGILRSAGDRTDAPGHAPQIVHLSPLLPGELNIWDVFHLFMYLLLQVL